MSTKCLVLECRFSRFHLTAGHKCGTCRRYGHGQYECGRGGKIAELKEKTRSDILSDDEMCDVVACTHKYNHLTQSHQCSTCRRVYSNCTCGGCITNDEVHRARDSLAAGAAVAPVEEKVTTCKVLCPICRVDNDVVSVEDCKIFGLEQKCSVCMDKTLEMRLPQCKHACLCMGCFGTLSRVEQKDGQQYYTNAVEIARPVLDLEPDRSYVNVYAGMGCAIYVKKVDGVYSTFFMHSDSWGQYGPTTDDRPAMNRFLRGCTQVHEHELSLYD